jgi:deoxyribonuclease-4
MTKSKPLLLGAHMSIAGGFDKAIERGESIDCTTIQIFTKSNRQWNAKPITQEQADLFIAKLKDSSIKTVVAHAMYLLNLASPDHKLWHGSITAVAQELERCNILEIPYLVVHPGSRLTLSLDEGLGRVTTAINRIFEKNTGKTMLLLENMAGQGSSVCSKFEELAQVLEGVEHKRRIGVCIDTCHAFAAGYDFRTKQTYKEFWRKVDETVGLACVKAIHLNDSKGELGCKVDRHEEIGDGKIGMEAFGLLMNDAHLQGVPKILETPNGDLKDFQKNMLVLKKLLK